MQFKEVMVVRLSYLVDILQANTKTLIININWQYLFQQLHNNKRTITYKYITPAIRFSLQWPSSGRWLWKKRAVDWFGLLGICIFSIILPLITNTLKTAICRPKHGGGVSYIYKQLSCCAVVRINNVYLLHGTWTSKTCILHKLKFQRA
jgi:hypothetical protein